MKQAMGIGLILLGATAWHIAVNNGKDIKNNTDIKGVWQDAVDTLRKGFTN